MPLLELHNISFGYSKQDKLITNFSFEAEAGEIIAISGDSGVGKTTLLKIFCKVIPAITHGDLTGNVLINNQNIENLSLPQLSPAISILMQEPENQLFLPTVEHELAFGPENLCIPADEILKRISNVLQILQIENLRHQDTATLSFGQKKMIAFASIITLSPQIILLDEPSAGLSPTHLTIFLDVIKQLAATGKLIILADHLPQALNIADRTIHLDGTNAELR